MISFYAHTILHTAEGIMPLDVSFRVGKGQLVSLYGNSGTGKTTILRLLAGLTKADRSLINADGIVWDDTEKKIHITPQQRSIGFVFQDYALFPHLTVKENIAFAVPENDREIVNELVVLMELEQLQHHKPEKLSGGQKQRVALARAVARQPKILLLDEPLSALDDDMRYRLQDFILKAHQQYQLTTIMVSHHLPEIIRLADHVIMIDKGIIARQGKPADIFSINPMAADIQMAGEIIAVAKNGNHCIADIFCNGTIVQLLLTETEAAGIKVGSKMLLSAGMLNQLQHK